MVLLRTTIDSKVPVSSFPCLVKSMNLGAVHELRAHFQQTFRTLSSFVPYFLPPVPCLRGRYFLIGSLLCPILVNMSNLRPQSKTASLLRHSGTITSMREYYAAPSFIEASLIERKESVRRRQEISNAIQCVKLWVL